MYYPKSQIITNLFTIGDEYVYLNTNNIYSGSYFKTGDGKVFSGRNPNDKPNLPLELSSINLNDFPPFNPELEEFPNSYDIIDDGYYWAKKISFIIQLPFLNPQSKSNPYLHQITII